MAVLAPSLHRHADPTSVSPLRSTTEDAMSSAGASRADAGERVLDGDSPKSPDGCVPMGESCEGDDMECTITQTEISYDSFSEEMPSPSESDGSADGHHETLNSTRVATIPLDGVEPAAKLCDASPAAVALELPPAVPKSTLIKEIRDALQCTAPDTHPFLCMEEQLMASEEDHAQRHYDGCVELARSAALTPVELAMSSRMLLHEAHRLQHRRMAQRGAEADEVTRAHMQWEHIQTSVERDLFIEGHAAVQRRLSCMCIFNPDSEERPYGDNEGFREQRCRRQELVLLLLQGMAENGAGHFFS